MAIKHFFSRGAVYYVVPCDEILLWLLRIKAITEGILSFGTVYFALQGGSKLWIGGWNCTSRSMI